MLVCISGQTDKL